jgi:hypothetical protein
MAWPSSCSSTQAKSRSTNTSPTRAGDGASLPVVAETEPPEEEQKGDVDLDVDARDASNPQRPAHMSPHVPQAPGVASTTCKAVWYTFPTAVAVISDDMN